MQKEVLEAGKKGQYGAFGGYMAIIDERDHHLVEWAPGAEEIIISHGWTVDEVYQRLITKNNGRSR